jgi:type III restriction enzyme
MKLELREFQESAVDQLLTQAGLARAEVASGTSKPQTLVLASPTGSGKTIMATAFIEQVLSGGEERDADPDATFLWFSYQPDLNDQTREKMIETSTVLGESDLIPVEAETFDQARFEPGRVYFVNAQKLGQDKRLITEGEGRSYTFWETIKRTRAAAAESFYVIIDEAHKGSQISAQAGAEAESIMQKFLLGSPGEIPPVDLVVGISATPQRFQDLAGHERIPRPVTVSPQAVRESGLLKDLVTLFHPDDAGPAADYTLLEEAASQFARFATEWESYSEDEAQPLVRPILVVQVEDVARRQATGTDLEAAIESIERGAGELNDAEIAHSFQEGSPVTVGDRTIRHLRPAVIDADPDVRVVFFKQSLNTGWDCPRAEVMMSFRRAQDRVHIAQLIGRMVRAPLVRRIEATELLNSVGLYLPRFDAEAVKEVVEYLTQADTDHGLPVEATSGKELVECKRIDSPEVVEAYEDLPSLTVPRDKTWSDRRRLLKLGRLLSEDELDPDAEDAALETVVGALEAEWKARKGKKAFKDALEAKANLVLRAHEVEYGGETSSEVASKRLGLAEESVATVFAVAGRRLGNGLHLAYLKRRSQAKSSLRPEEIELELATLTDDEFALDAVDAAAKAELDALMAKHRTGRKQLPPDRRGLYDEIQRTARDPELAELGLPTAIQVRRDNAARTKHLFTNGKGRFPGKLNSWEGRVIDEELKRDEVVAWLRNIDRKGWALCVPYEYEGRLRALYPDLIVFRKVGEILVDILDPHRHDLDDAWAKAKGLAQYAAKYGADHFGRIQVIAVETDTVRRIELNDEKWRKKALKLDSNGALKELYEQAST